MRVLLMLVYIVFISVISGCGSGQGVNTGPGNFSGNPYRIDSSGNKIYLNPDTLEPLNQ